SGLCRSPGKPIQNKAALAIRLAQALLNQPAHQSVWSQLSARHIGVRFHSQFAAMAEAFPQNITGGNLRRLKIRSDPFGLRPLARARRPEQTNRSDVAR